MQGYLFSPRDFKNFINFKILKHMQKKVEFYKFALENMILDF